DLSHSVLGSLLMPRRQALAHTFELPAHRCIVLARGHACAQPADQPGIDAVMRSNEFFQLAAENTLDFLPLPAIELSRRSNLGGNPTRSPVYLRFELAPHILQIPRPAMLYHHQQ